jgi:hypothetical protein
MNEEASFWVIPDINKMRTPISIMKEQAELLTSKTEGLLVGEIQPSINNEFIVIRLFITVPALRNYRYSLLQYTQPITLYPGTMYWPTMGQSTQVSDEKTFLESLKAILSSPQTQQVIAGLLAQAREA